MTLTGPLRAQALTLRGRLNREGRADPTAVATAAHALFSGVGDVVRANWLALELGGYGSVLDTTPLATVLTVRPTDRLAVHVAAYRAQQGRAPDAGMVFRHFFVEPLSQILNSREQARSWSGTEIELNFSYSPSTPHHPTRALFPGDVFDRIVVGFGAALYFQLAAAAAA